MLCDGFQSDSVLLVAQKPLICFVAHNLSRALYEFIAPYMPCQSILLKESADNTPLFSRCERSLILLMGSLRGLPTELVTLAPSMKILICSCGRMSCMVLLSEISLFRPVFAIVCHR